ncbi:MAG TPA: hypothetical protein VMT06_00760 [Candidatus Eisenbacteria bacterium]|nr:hypothetical protein [Candidatus Eisenbacteria bacterium]
MLLKYLQGKYLVNRPIQECSLLVQEALDELGMKDVTVRKEVPPRYLLVQYSPGWVGKNFEIEFFFKERENGTEINVKWPYAEEVPPPGEDKYVSMYTQLEEERKQKMKKLIEDFKSKIGATEIPQS